MTETMPSLPDGVPASQWNAIIQAATPAALVAALRAQDVRLALHEGRIQIDAPAALRVGELKAILARRRADILSALQHEAAFEHKVLTMVRQIGEPTPREVARRLHCPVDQVREALVRLHAQGKLVQRSVKQGSFR
jgi:hypothetical protein